LGVAFPAVPVQVQTNCYQEYSAPANADAPPTQKLRIDHVDVISEFAYLVEEHLTRIYEEQVGDYHEYQEHPILGREGSES